MTQFNGHPNARTERKVRLTEQVETLEYTVHLLTTRTQTLEKQNAEYIEALREAKQIILELEGARFMKTSFYDQINSLLK